MKNTLTNLIPPNTNEIYVALSGGADSTSALWMAVETSIALNIPCSAIHINHNINKQSKAWEKHCEKLCLDFGIPLISHQVKFETSKNIEEKARNERYSFFEKTLNKNDILVTGHNADDLSETFLLMMTRGSGLRGLSAMGNIQKKNHYTLIRPLLDKTKKEILRDITGLGLGWVEDDSNQDNTYDRNFIRNNVLPELAKNWGGINQQIAQSAKQIFEANKYIEEKIYNDFSFIIDNDKLNCSELLKTNNFEQFEIIKMWVKKHSIIRPNKKLIKEIISSLAQTSTNREQAAKICIHNIELRKFKNNIHIIKKQKNNSLNNDLYVYKGNRKVFIKKFMSELKIPYWERNNNILETNNMEVVKIKGYWSKD